MSKHERSAPFSTHVLRSSMSVASSGEFGGMAMPSPGSRVPTTLRSKRLSVGDDASTRRGSDVDNASGCKFSALAEL